jgi:hypothetical protein
LVGGWSSFDVRTGLGMALVSCCGLQLASCGRINVAKANCDLLAADHEGSVKFIGMADTNTTAALPLATAALCGGALAYM